MDQERENVDMHVLSGKFLVAGELLRQYIAATITCEVANECEVIARNGRTIIPIQVGTERDTEWRLDNNAAEPDDSIWVLVNLPRENLAPNEFFVLTGAELRAIVKPKHDAYEESMKGIPRLPEWSHKYSVSRDEVGNYKDAWGKVRKALGRPQ